MARAVPDSIGPTEAQHLQIAWRRPPNNTNEMAMVTRHLGINVNLEGIAADITKLLERGDNRTTARQLRNSNDLVDGAIRTNQTATVILSFAGRNNRLGEFRCHAGNKLQNLGGGCVNVDLAARKRGEKVRETDHVHGGSGGAAKTVSLRSDSAGLVIGRTHPPIEFGRNAFDKKKLGNVVNGAVFCIVRRVLSLVKFVLGALD